VRVLRAEGRSWAHIAQAIRDSYSVNARIAFRWAHGWTQEQVAAEWCALWPDDLKTGQNISTWERWPESGHEPSLRTLTRLAEVYQADLSDLVVDLGCFSHLDPANSDPVIRSVRDLTAASEVSDGRHGGRQDDTDRRDFTKAAALTAAGLLGPLWDVLAAGADERVTVIGRRHLEVIESAVERIEAQDAEVGGSALRSGVAALRGRVEEWLNGPDFSVHGVGGELQSLAGELSAWSGWIAFDADDRTEAASLLQDALLHARLIDDPALEVRALSYICLLNRDRRPRESLQCAEAALQRARGWATPRLLALLHLRAARASASLNERKAFSREIANAKTQLEHGVHDDDPLYIRFVGHMEVAGITGLSYLAMDQPGRAATEFRRITDNPDATYKRNTGYYTVRLAEAVARQHDISQASEIGLGAIPAVRELGSARTMRHLRSLRSALEPHRSAVPAARDFIDAYEEAVG
jgi:transcriptional regulator with XRE-family HTH domain